MVFSLLREYLPQLLVIINQYSKCYYNWISEPKSSDMWNARHSFSCKVNNTMIGVALAGKEFWESSCPELRPHSAVIWCHLLVVISSRFGAGDNSESRGSRNVPASWPDAESKLRKYWGPEHTLHLSFWKKFTCLSLPFMTCPTSIPRPPSLTLAYFNPTPDPYSCPVLR